MVQGRFKGGLDTVGVVGLFREGVEESSSGMALG